jgi:hypothetical protein
MRDGDPGRKNSDFGINIPDPQHWKKIMWKLSFICFVVVDRGVNAIVYMVDAADSDKIEAARNELHNLLEKPQLAGIPVLVLGNDILYTDLTFLGIVVC